jgi:hypothetical protein
VADTPLAKSMQNLAFRYTRWINRRERRTGHLFQGRDKAILVERDPYLLALMRYIHLHPVRAGLVQQPEDFPWSGHRAYLGSDGLPWLTFSRVTRHLHKSDGRPRPRPRGVDTRALATLAGSPFSRWRQPSRPCVLTAIRRDSSLCAYQGFHRRNPDS